MGTNRRVMIAGTGSGCGKTTIVCALLAVLSSKGEEVVSFKCGPDYVDPMFHRKVTGIESRNLDIFLMGEEGVKKAVFNHEAGDKIAVIEGVMGLYDGMGEDSFASSNHISLITDTPVILAADVKGMALSVCAMIKGYLEFEKNNIHGVILNGVNEPMYRFYKKMIEDRTGISVIGYMPHIPEAQIESRRLGLVAADEIDDICEKIEVLKAQALESIDIAALLDIIGQSEPSVIAGKTKQSSLPMSDTNKAMIYVAADEAFCFWYEANHDLLKAFGAEIRFFSPVNDKDLPADADGLVLWGGYQDLYASALENNSSMKESLKTAMEAGLPVYAESGGFVYLMESLTDTDGNSHEMLGVLPGKIKVSDKLQNFGYHELEAQRDTLLCKAGDKINAHFFHYYTGPYGDSFLASKKGKTFPCIISLENIFAGFQHLHFKGNPGFAESFVNACLKYKDCRQDNEG